MILYIASKLFLEFIYQIKYNGLEEVIPMPTIEKEINNYLFDQLEIVEDVLELLPDDDSPAVKYLKKKKEKIERKLYQNPPLSKTEN